MVTPGNYTIVASKTGWIHAHDPITVYNTSTNDAGTINLSPITVSGKVTGSSGNPIGGATITAGSLSASTRVTGTYTLSYVPSGSENITASVNGYGDDSDTINVIEGNNTGVSFRLHRNCPGNGDRCRDRACKSRALL